ncbi:MAG: hypothetical protein P8P70_13375 [Sulfitobacter sp.]|nr:hypothetical protein [Sulfitobacter sp.]
MLVRGVFLATMVLFSEPNFFGLRPHAVKRGLDIHSAGDFLALAEHGSVTGILTYDTWYKDRDGQTGWFFLPSITTKSLPFAVNGLLDPGLSKLFGTAPRRCVGPRPCRCAACT